MRAKILSVLKQIDLARADLNSFMNANETIPLKQVPRLIETRAILQGLHEQLQEYFEEHFGDEQGISPAEPNEIYDLEK